ncbi:hypothetical protein [Thioclava sp.]|uniref:hypothetical protein n=1 Tax=Thioclava sp. TaxID=1933450 RepID=UPI0032423BD2
MPMLLPGAEEFFFAFMEISTDRQWIMGPDKSVPGPIPSASIDRWIDRNGHGYDEPLVRGVFRAMDNEFQAASSTNRPVTSVRPLTPDLLTGLFQK